MDFSLTKQENLFLQMIREFAENEVKPLAAEIDEQERFPMETVEKMAKIGIMGIPIPKQYGGQGGTTQMYSMAVEELSRVCATTGVVVSAHTSLCAEPILMFGILVISSIWRKIIAIWLHLNMSLMAKRRL